jgi:hypothetical protein
MTIEKELIWSVIIYNIISLMQQWTELLSGKEQELIKMAQAWIQRMITKVGVNRKCGVSTEG